MLDSNCVAITVAGTRHTTSKHNVVIPKTQVSHHNSQNPAILGLEENNNLLADFHYNIHLKYEGNFFLELSMHFLEQNNDKNKGVQLSGAFAKL